MRNISEREPGFPDEMFIPRQGVDQDSYFKRSHPNERTIGIEIQRRALRYQFIGATVGDHLLILSYRSRSQRGHCCWYRLARNGQQNLKQENPGREVKSPVVDPITALSNRRGAIILH